MKKNFDSDGVDDVESDEEIVEYKFDLTFYGADYPVDSLVKRLANKDVVIPSFDPVDSLVTDVEAFQRKFVWNKMQCDRFIESLLLGMPVPGIFLVQQGDKRLLVLDGQQRLLTLAAFYKGILNKKEFVLESTQKKFKGLAYASLDGESRRTLDDSIIHATVIKKTQESDDLSSIYSLFERLNSGGTQLSPHEIRVALVPGPLTQLIRDLNMTPSWRVVYGQPSKTLKDHELILRFLALRFYSASYKSPMKDYLTEYAKYNSSLDKQDSVLVRNSFVNTIDIIHAAIGGKAFRIKNALNAAVFDSIMVGVSHRISSGSEIEPARLAAVYKKLLTEPAYFSAVSKATAREDQVEARVTAAINAFQEV